MLNIQVNTFNKIENMKKDDFSRFYYKKSRLQQLKGFYYVYQTGSISSAAEQMGLGISTITTQIKSLEKDLNITLFDRVKNRLIPTKDADLLYKMAVPVIHSSDSLFKTFLYHSNENKNNYIHLACHSNVSYEILPKVIKEFKEDHPKSIFEIENIPFDDAIKKIINEEIDFAIYPTDNNKRIYKEVEYLDFYEDQLVLIMHKDHWLAKKQENEITKDDIAKTNFVCMDKSLFIKHKYLDFLLNNENFNNDLLLVNGDWEMVKAMVKENLCISGVSEHYINSYDKSTIVTKVLKNIFPSLKYCIIIKKGVNLKENVNIFLDLLKSKYC